MRLYQFFESPKYFQAVLMAVFSYLC